MCCSSFLTQTTRCRTADARGVPPWVVGDDRFAFAAAAYTYGPARVSLQSNPCDVLGGILSSLPSRHLSGCGWRLAFPRYRRAVEEPVRRVAPVVYAATASRVARSFSGGPIHIPLPLVCGEWRVPTSPTTLTFYLFGLGRATITLTPPISNFSMALPAIPLSPVLSSWPGTEWPLRLNSALHSSHPVEVDIL